MGHATAPTREAVIWLGRTLGRAVRHGVDAARIPGSILRHVVSARDVDAPEPPDASRADAKLVGGRIAWDRGATARGAGHQVDVTEALSDPDPVVRVRALQTLGRLSKQRAEHLVAPMLHDPHPAVRVAAAETAGELGARSAVFSLILGLDDDDERVRAACHQAFGEVTGRAPWEGRLGEAARAERIAALRAWWKEERIARLARRGRDEPLSR